MATTTFTTWTALYQAALNRLANYVAGASFEAEELKIDTGGSSKSIKYRSFEELQSKVQYLKSMADMEAGAAVGRTYAKNGGRGR